VKLGEIHLDARGACGVAPLEIARPLGRIAIIPALDGGGDKGVMNR
jgi:hypothetical protein